MAEAQAAPQGAEAPQVDAPAPEAQEPKAPLQARSYSQEELDRILNKVRKNARYLGKKEAEAEFGRPPQKEPEQQKPAEDREPKREDYQDYESYLDARAEFKARKATRDENSRIEREREQRSEEERSVKVAADFKKHANALITEIPDFAEVIEDAQDVKITKAMAGEMEDAGALGPRMLYELAKNPEEAARIAALPVKEQIREMTKMQARLEAQKAPKKEAPKEDPAEEKAEGKDKGDEPSQDKERNVDGTFKPTKKAAPEPIEPSATRGASTGAVPGDKDDIKTWMRKAEDQAKREGRR